MVIASGLIALGFEPMTDFVVQDDGEGPYIKEWSSEQPRPSDAETQAAAEAAAMAAIQIRFSAAIQSHLDAKARERQYDGIQTAVSYRNDPNPKFAAEAAALFEWRSAAWTYATAEMSKVMTGERAMPTVRDILADLPEFVWFYPQTSA